MVFLLAACAPQSQSSPWGSDGTSSSHSASTGTASESLPDIGWQNETQRQEQTVASAPSLVKLPPQRKATVVLLLPLTGKKADLGQAMLKAAQMALFDVGSTNFELIPKDTHSTKEGAMAAAQSLLTTQVDLVLGPIFAEDLKAIKPILAASNIPVISFSTDWAQADNKTYIMGFLPFPQVARVAKYAMDKGYLKFAVYAPQTEYCDVVIRTLQSTGANIVSTGRYAASQPDLTASVKDFIRTSHDNYNVLMLPVGGESLRSLVSVFDVNGLKQNAIKFIGTGLWDDTAVMNNPSLYGGWFAAPDPALRADFEKRYQENYGVAPLRLVSLAYDATALASILAHSHDGAGTPYDRDSLTNPRGFAGIDGIFRFRSDSLAERGLAVLEVHAGKARVIDPAPTAFIGGS
jgi:ABC-type branched-subunit amino acid transport system substrate-binding protein